MHLVKVFLTRFLAIAVFSNLAACGGGGDSAPPPPRPGIVFSKQNLATSEDGTVQTFQVRLATKPTDYVDIDIESLDTTEGLIRQAGSGFWSWDVSLTFHPSDWDTWQTIEIQGQNDATVDGNQTYDVAVTWVWSWDLDYIDVPKPTLAVTNSDNDIAGITVQPAAALSTAEDGTTDTFTVVLNTEPTADVVIPVTANDTTEGLIKGGDSPATDVATLNLTFTSANWNSAQTVTVTGQDEYVADGNQNYSITVGTPSSADTDYSALTAQTVSVTNNDDDTAAVTVTAASPLRTSEYGTTDAFTVVLNTEPTADVVIPVTANDATEGLIKGGDSPATDVATLNLTFTAADWSTPQTVTVTGQDDTVSGDNPVYTIEVGVPTGAAEYTALSAQTVSVLNTDNEVATFSILQDNLATSENGATATFTVVINKAPASDVIIPVSSGDTGEGLVMGGNSPATPVGTIDLTFTPADWQTPQTVTVVGQADFTVDGNQAYAINVGPPTGDTDYAVLAAQTVSVTNTDIDVAGYTVSRTSVSTTEASWTGSFTVVLNTRPSADVVIPVTSGDPGEALLQGGDSPSAYVDAINLTFTPADWQTAQTVTVSGQDDYTIDGTQTVPIAVGSPVSTDANYDGLTAKAVTAYVYDNNSAGINISPTSGLVTSEDGTTATFTVTLNSIPTANVLVPVSTMNAAEGKVSGGDALTAADNLTLTFTPGDWSTPQVVTAHGQDDAVLDGPQDYEITVGAVSSADNNYNGLNAQTVASSNSDNEVGVSQSTTLDITALLPYDGQVGPAADGSSYYMVTGLTGTALYDVTVTGVTDDVSLYVYSNSNFNAGLLCSSANAGTKTSESCRATAPAGGIIYIEIDGTPTQNGAAFTVNVLGPFHAYWFETFANGSGSGTDTYIELYHSSDTTNRIAFDDDSGTGTYSGMQIDLASGETYYLKVRGYQPSSTGAYSVQISDTGFGGSSSGTPTDADGEPDDIPAEAATLIVNTPVDRTLTSGDNDWFVFTVP